MKLTKAIKENILGRIIRHRFAKTEEELTKAKEAFALDIYCALYTPDEIKKMRALPEGWLKTVTAVRLRTAFDGWHGYSLGEEEGRLPIQDHKGYELRVNDNKEPIYVKFLDLQEKIDATRQARRKAELDIDAVLNSVTTVNRLLTVWPEAEQFILASSATFKRRSLPVPIINELNKKLDLPPEEKLLK